MADRVRRDIIRSIEAEYRRHKALGERAFRQLPTEALGRAVEHENSVATNVWHISGNLESRFTDFLTTDGEKPWRDRDSEFEPREGASREELEEKWARGWAVLFDALASLSDENLSDVVVIRGLELMVHEALHRSVAHAAYHVGQIVQTCRRVRGDDWTYLSIPPGKSEEYNRNPTIDSAGAHTSTPPPAGT